MEGCHSMKIEKNKFDTVSNILSVMILIGISIYLLVSWNNIPQEIPRHYNGAGEADIISSKTALIFPMIIAWLLYIGLSTVERYPQMWNTGVTVTENNRERVYRTLKNMLNIIKLILVLVFSYVIINSSLGLNLSPYFIPILLLLIFGTLIFYIVQLVKIK